MSVIDRLRVALAGTEPPDTINPEPVNIDLIEPDPYTIADEGDELSNIAPPENPPLVDDYRNQGLL